MQINSIADLLSLFQLASNPQNTQILVKGTGSAANAVPFNVFCAYLGKTFKVENGVLTYYDENGAVQNVNLKLTWDTLTEEEQQSLINHVKEGATEEISQVTALRDQLNAKETERRSNEDERKQNETERQENETSREEDFEELRTRLEEAIEAVENANANLRRKCTEAIDDKFRLVSEETWENMSDEEKEYGKFYLTY